MSDFFERVFAQELERGLVAFLGCLDEVCAEQVFAGQSGRLRLWGTPRGEEIEADGERKWEVSEGFTGVVVAVVEEWEEPDDFLGMEYAGIEILVCSPLLAESGQEERHQRIWAAVRGAFSRRDQDGRLRWISSEMERAEVSRMEMEGRGVHAWDERQWVSTLRVQFCGRML